MESYTVAALAARLGVPRTTINDWLTRYGNYIDSENLGRRRIFSARSLAVLQEIVELRDQGKSGFEIETELARRHGVSPEIAVPQMPEAPDDNRPAAASAPPPEEPSLPPALRDLERNFSDLGAWMCDMREFQQMQHQRQRWLLGLLVVLVVLLLVGSLVGWQVAKHLAEWREQQTHVFQNELTRTKTEISDRMTAQLSNLEKQLQDERQRARELLETEKKLAEREKSEVAAKAQAALNAERRQWADDMRKLQQEMLAGQNAERRDLLARWEKSARESEARTHQETSRTQEDLKRLHAELETANRQLAEARRTLAERPAPAPVPAAAAPALTPVPAAGTGTGK